MDHKNFINKYFPNAFTDEQIEKYFCNIICFNNLVTYFFADTLRSPEELCHYTSIEALCNILKTQKIWLFDFNEMNDPNEVVQGVEHIQQSLRKLYKQKNITKETVLEILDCFSSGMHDSKKNDTRFFSLTDRFDHLPSWRWYGDNGKGVCVKFSKWEINDFYRTKVIYNDNLFLELVELFLMDINKGRPFITVSSYLKLITALVKKDYYKEENEWRLFPNGSSELEAKEVWVNNKLRRYYEIPLVNKDSSFPITEIIVGPSANPKAVDYLKRLTESLGLQINKIEQSQKHYNNESNLAAKCLEDRKCMYKDLGEEKRTNTIQLNKKR